MKLSLSKLYFIIFTFALVILLVNCSSKEIISSGNLDDFKNDEIFSILKTAGENSNQIKTSIENCPSENKEGLHFLLQNMPDRDLRNLTSDFLLTNLNYSYKVLDSVKWGNKIPKEIFLNYVLPYSNLHERRDNWRKDFFIKFFPLVKNLNSTSEAVLKLNKEIWDMVNVHYSTKRPKADQSPYESIDAGIASCTGLSILLIDVCRAVGIPARFVGIPLWKDHSGNHSWIEIWDNGWHFIGAAEESPLNQTWFGERAALSDDTNWKYSIYASSFKKTNVIFPPLFDSTATYVYADIVTNFYNKKLLEDGKINLAIRLFDKKNGNRIEGKITVKKNNLVIVDGTTKDEKHDFNDYLIVKLEPKFEYEIIAAYADIEKKKVITVDESKYQFCNFIFNE
ncbi:MAG: transglutaminase domain-containing protein [Ignavibacteriae bacterium]|nr:transglutaminase domain-containing protein [Ignavibacteriota bacterium]